jgi:hypothetical protein
MKEIEPCYWKVLGCKCLFKPMEVGTKEDEKYCALAGILNDKIESIYYLISYIILNCLSEDAEMLIFQDCLMNIHYLKNNLQKGV